MEKSSLNIKFLRNLFPRRQGRSYKIPRENDNVKIHSGIINSSTTNCNVDDIYTMRRGGERNRKPKVNNNDCDQKRIRGLICGNLTRILNHHNSTFFLPILTGVSCRYENMFFNQNYTHTIWRWEVLWLFDGGMPKNCRMSF